MIVGRFLGVDALAAVGSTTSLNFLVVGWITGMTSGFGILISQAYGAKDEKRLRHYVAMSTYLCVILAIIMTTGLLLANGWILTTMNTPEKKFMQIHGNILRLFMRDFRQRFFTICLLRLQDLWGDSKTPLVFLVLSSILNIGLDFLWWRNSAWSIRRCLCDSRISGGIRCFVFGLCMEKKYEIGTFRKRGESNFIAEYSETFGDGSSDGAAVFYYSDWDDDCTVFAESAWLYVHCILFCNK